jgi:hypothetical protein
MRNATRVKAAIAAALLLAGCDIFESGDQFLEGFVEGSVTFGSVGVGDAAVSVYRTTAGCATCPGDRINSGVTSATGSYRMHISIDRADQDGRGFAVVVLPSAASNLNGDTVPFTPRLNPTPTETVQVNVVLTPKP